MSFPEAPLNYVPHVHAAPLTEHETSLLPIRIFRLDIIYMTFGCSLEDDPTYFRLSLFHSQNLCFCFLVAIQMLH